MAVVSRKQSEVLMGRLARLGNVAQVGEDFGSQPTEPVKRSFDMDDEQVDRWWPAKPEARIEFQGMELIANLLGPVLNRELASLLSDAEDRGLELSDEMKQLRDALWQVDGLAPQMLAFLAHAVALTHELDQRLDRETQFDEEYVEIAFRRRLEVLKHLGWAAHQAAGRYGLSRDTWPLFARDLTWPPPGVAYRKYV
jgi:hypothetical protein